MKTVTETERLILREFTTDDAPFIYRLPNTPGWPRFTGNRHIHDVESASQYPDRAPMSSYRTPDFGLWAVVLKDTGIPVGMCGLPERDFPDAPDIGFALLPEFGGTGHAYELAMAAMDHSPREWGISRIVAIVSKDHVRSVRLSEQPGMAYKGTVSCPVEDEPPLLPADRPVIHTKTIHP